MARPMPVLPDVGSMIVVMPGVMRPARSAAKIIDAPMRSLTEHIGLNDSSLTRTSAAPVAGKRFKRTSGVWPMVSSMLLLIFGRRDMKIAFMKFIRAISHSLARRQAQTKGDAGRRRHGDAARREQREYTTRDD